MVVFVYGAAHLLRTPARLSGLTVLLVGSIVILSAQILFDRAGSGFEYNRGGQNLPSIPHSGGIHGTSLWLTLGLPLASVGLVTGRFVWRGMASATLAVGLFVTAYLNGSRGGLVSMDSWSAPWLSLPWSGRPAAGGGLCSWGSALRSFRSESEH